MLLALKNWMVLTVGNTDFTNAGGHYLFKELFQIITSYSREDQKTCFLAEILNSNQSCVFHVNLPK